MVWGRSRRDLLLDYPPGRRGASPKLSTPRRPAVPVRPPVHHPKERWQWRGRQDRAWLRAGRRRPRAASAEAGQLVRGPVVFRWNRVPSKGLLGADGPRWPLYLILHPNTSDQFRNNKRTVALRLSRLAFTPTCVFCIQIPTSGKL